MTSLVARKRLRTYAPLHITPTLDLQERKGLSELAVLARTSIKGDTNVPDQTTCRQDQTVDGTSLQGLVVVVVAEMADPLSIALVMGMVGRL